MIFCADVSPSTTFLNAEQMLTCTRMRVVQIFITELPSKYAFAPSPCVRIINICYKREMTKMDKSDKHLLVVPNYRLRR